MSWHLNTVQWSTGTEVAFKNSQCLRHTNDLPCYYAYLSWKKEFILFGDKCEPPPEEIITQAKLLID